MPETILVSHIQNVLTSADLKVLGNGLYESGNAEFRIIIEVLGVSLAEKSIRLRTSHQTFELVFKDDLDLVLDKMGIKRSGDIASKDIKAPMPGKVIDVIARVGDKLQKGDNILILEAMKMENVLKAENDCTVRKINIRPQENVEKNQVLVELEF